MSPGNNSFFSHLAVLKLRSFGASHLAPNGAWLEFRFSRTMAGYGYRPHVKNGWEIRSVSTGRNDVPRGVEFEHHRCEVRLAKERYPTCQPVFAASRLRVLRVRPYHRS